MSNNSKNDPPVVQVLTAGGAGVRRHKDKVVNKNKKNKSLVPIESNHDNDDEHETTRPLVHWNLSGDGLSSHQQQASLAMTPDPGVGMGLEYEPHEEDPDIEDVALNDEDCEPTQRSNNNNTKNSGSYSDNPSSASKLNSNRSSATKAETMTVASSSSLSAPTAISSELVWLAICFFGIMASFVLYGLLLEYSTSGGRKLHELSFLFVTSGLYTLTAAAGRYVRDETPTTIPPARFAILGLTSMASTWCSIRSLRYVIFPIQVLAKSCKPVPVMLMGAVMGKKYPARKYINVCMIVTGVALFMGFGDKRKKEGDVESAENMSSTGQLIGIMLLFVSLCFDGGTGAYEDKLMSVHSVQPFDLMFNIQLGKTILAGIGLLVFNQLHIFLQMVQDMGFLLVGLGFTGALGQVFIFVTIAKFGALTCSIIGLARKVTTLVASIYFYGHSLNTIQMAGLAISIASMVMDFMGKQKKGVSHGHHGGAHPPIEPTSTELEKMLGNEDDDDEDSGEIALATTTA